MIQTSFITMPSMVVIVGCVPAVDEKSVMFFFFVCLSDTLSNYKVCDNGNAIFKTVMVSLHTGRFAVVHLYSTFSVDSQNFPLGANFYQKLPFCDFWAVSPHF